MLRKRTMLASLIEDGGGNDANCILLLHLDNNRTNASSSGITITQNNTIPFTTTYKKFGTHSLNCTSAYYYPSSTTLINNALSNGITVDYWVKVNQTDSGDYKADFAFGRGSYYVGVAVATYSNKLICRGWDGSSINFNIEYPYNWGSGFNHIAVTIEPVSSVSRVKVYINGDFVGGTLTIYPISSNSTYSYIAGGFSFSGAFGGGAITTNVMDEFRVSNSIRWTKNFTPPISAYV